MAAPAAPTRQTRVVATRYASADADVAACLSVERNAPVPQPQPGEMLLRVLLRPIHPADILLVKGVYPGSAGSPPLVPGYEGLAEVVDANGVAGWTAGEPAYAFLGGTRGRSEGQGSWQQFVAAPPWALTRPPAGVPDAVAAQLRGNPASALGLLETLAPPPGEWLVHSAAASTLGRMLIAMARLRGVRSVAVLRSRAGREHQASALQQLGADAILTADEDDIAARVMELTAGRGAWGATDAVAGEMSGRLAAAVRPGGTVLVYGMLAGTTCTVEVADIMGRDVTLRGFALNRWMSCGGEQQPHVAKALAQLDAWLASGAVVPAVARTARLEDAREAVAAALAPGGSGKVLLEG